MAKKKKSVELNFGAVLIILIIILVAVFFVARKTGTNIISEITNTLDIETNKEYEQNLYAKNLITIDIGKLNDKWKVEEQEYGSIIFYIQGPKKENEDGTFNDIRINIYMQKSEMTNDELKTQMLEDSIYSDIEYTKMQEINSIKWMEFQAKNKGVKAKILTIMKDGYMFAAEITGEDSLYDENYNDAMKSVMTIQISEKIPLEKASELIYKYDNLANIYAGGAKYLVTSLNLPQTMELTEELPEEYVGYIPTGVKYDDFANEMKKYMTDGVLKNRFGDCIEFNGGLYIKDTTGNQIDYMIEDIQEKGIRGSETTYEVVKSQMELFITQREAITIKLEDGKYIVSNVE